MRPIQQDESKSHTGTVTSKLKLFPEDVKFPNIADLSSVNFSARESRKIA